MPPAQTTAAVLFVGCEKPLEEEVAASLGDEAAVIGAATGEAAFRAATRNPPAVVVIDAQHEDIAAEALAARIRTLSPSVRAVFLGASGVTAGRLLGIGAVLPKPVDPERLLQAIRHAVRLVGMSAGVQRMRTRTGSFVATPPTGDRAPGETRDSVSVDVPPSKGKPRDS